MLIFVVIFGRIAHLPSDGMPYPVFTFAALLPWTYLAYVIQQASNSLVNNTSLITKVYFPRFALPVGVALAGLIDLGLTFVVFAVLLLVYHIHPGGQIAFLPVFLLLTVAISLGVGAWLAALNVQYRDVRYVVPFLLQIWLLLSPVGYSANLVHGKLAPIYALNPMVGAIDGFRWCLLGTPPPSGQEMALSVAVALILLVSGLLYFRRMERSIADVI